jgi:DNA-directed RNA polymerase specialized sigma24 family protein
MDRANSGGRRVPQLQQNQIDRALDTLCEYYLPRVFQYFHYWVSDVDYAEKLAVETLKQAVKKIDSLDQKTESITIRIFSLARKYIRCRSTKNQSLLKGLSSAECDVIALKMGAELSNSSIGNILGLTDSRVGKLLSGSLIKLKNDFDKK